VYMTDSRWAKTLSDIAEESELRHAGLLALGYALRAEEAKDAEEALRFKALSERWRRVARATAHINEVRRLIAEARRVLKELDDAIES